MRLDLRALVELGQLLGFAKHRERGLSLRIDANEMPARFGDAEHRLVNLEADHRLDELAVLGKPFLVDLQLVGLHLLAEVEGMKLLLLFRRARIEDRLDFREAGAAGIFHNC